LCQCSLLGEVGKFRFNPRDLLWLTAVVGLAVGWWLDRARLSEALAVSDERANRLEFAIEGARGFGWTIESQDLPDGSEQDTVKPPQ
jgi:hypothetical protein